MLHIPGLYIGHDIQRGRGVYSAQSLQPGELIEICPVILIPSDEKEAIHQTVLHDYYFIWPDEQGSIAILLGYGSLYNHRDPPNTKVYFDIDEMSVEIRCVEAIQPGDEIFINYRDGEESLDGLWFDPT